MEITRTSMYSGIQRTMDLKIAESEMRRWEEEPYILIQDCFPNISADDREFIKSGITAEEWDEMFGSDIEE